MSTTRTRLLAVFGFFLSILLYTPSLQLAHASKPKKEDAPTTTTGTSPSASIKQKVNVESPVKIGQPVEMTLTINHPSGAQVFVPEETGNPRWSIVKDEIKSNTGEQQHQTVVKLTLLIWRPGSTTLPPMNIVVTTPEGEQLKLNTEALTLKVLSTLPDTDEEPSFKPSLPPVKMFVHDYRLLWGGLTAAALAFFALFVFLFMRRRIQAAIPPPPPTPIHVVAMERLSKLATGDLEDRESFLVFYTTMSEVVREYLGKLHGFPGTELTTTEIMNRVKDVSWPLSLSSQDVHVWLDECDRAKFTKHTPDVSSAETALRKAFSIVELTRQHEEDREKARQEEQVLQNETLPDKQDAPGPFRKPEKRRAERFERAMSALDDEKEGDTSTETAPPEDTLSIEPMDDATQDEGEGEDLLDEEDEAHKQRIAHTALGGFSFDEVVDILNETPDEEEPPEEIDALPKEEEPIVLSEVPFETQEDDAQEGDVEDQKEEEERP